MSSGHGVGRNRASAATWNQLRCSVFGECVEIRRRTSNRSSASSGDRQVYYIGTTTFGIETPLNKRLRLRIRCFNTCILRLHLRSGRLNENSWNFYRTMSHFSESLLICYSRTMVIVSFHFNIDGNRVTVIIKL